MNAKQIERLSLSGITKVGIPRAPKSGDKRRKQKQHNGIAGQARCTNRCIEGRKCTLCGDVKHDLCICKNPNCTCHSRQRYEGWE